MKEASSFFLHPAICASFNWLNSREKEKGIPLKSTSRPSWYLNLNLSLSMEGMGVLNTTRLFRNPFLESNNWP